MKNKPNAEFVGYCPEMPEQVFRPILQLHKELKDFAERSQLLGRDVSRCVESINKSPQDAFWRRVLVRSVFTFLEGGIYGLKRMALSQSEIYEVEFSPAEIALLREEKYSLDDKGEANIQSNNFQRFIPNLKFAFRSYAKAHGLRLDADMSKLPLKEFEAVRNRITHPKTVSDLTISDDEITKAQQVGQWFLNQVTELVQKSDDESLPVRIPRVSTATRLNVTKDFVVMQPDGNVYQFEKLEEAEKYRDSQIVKDLPFMTPLVYRTEDLRKGNLPE